MKYWLKYSKKGTLRFIGHLDMMRTWERIFRRAGLPLALSQGFSPKPQFSLAAPLPLGMESEAEYLELQLKEKVEDLSQLLSPQLPRGLAISGFRPAAETPSLMGLVRYGSYTVYLPAAQMEGFGNSLRLFMEQKEVLHPVRRKDREKVVDIRPLVKTALLTPEGLQVTLALGGAGNLRIEDFLSHFSVSYAQATVTRQELFLLPGEELLTPFAYLAAGKE